MLSSDCPPDQIVVQQVVEEWRVIEHNHPEEGFRKLELALARALAIFREQRHERKRIVVLPPDSPWMWD